MATLADVTKVLRNDSKLVELKRIAPNGAVTTSNQTYINKATATGNRSRQKPNPLTPTTLLITDIFRETAIETRVIGSVYGTFIGPPDYVYSQFPSWSTVTRTIDFTDGSAAKNRALAKATDFSFGISIAESKQTVNLLLKTLSRLGSFASALKRGDLSKASSVLNVDLSLKGMARLKGQSVEERLSSGYLEFQFGWLPLLNDASDIAKAYTKGLSTEGLKVSSRSGRQPSFKGRSGAELASYVPEASASFSGRVHNPAIQNLNNLGFLNAPLIAWNLVPLSFVFDWFIPVGTFLGGLTATAGLKDCSTCVTTGTMIKTFKVKNGVEILTDARFDGGRSVSTSIPTLLGLQPAALRHFGQVVSLAALSSQRFSSSGSRSIR